MPITPIAPQYIEDARERVTRVHSLAREAILEYLRPSKMNERLAESPAVLGALSVPHTTDDAFDGLLEIKPGTSKDRPRFEYAGETPALVFHEFFATYNDPIASAGCYLIRVNGRASVSVDHGTQTLSAVSGDLVVSVLTPKMEFESFTVDLRVSNVARGGFITWADKVGLTDGSRAESVMRVVDSCLAESSEADIRNAVEILHRAAGVWKSFPSVTHPPLGIARARIVQSLTALSGVRDKIAQTTRFENWLAEMQTARSYNNDRDRGRLAFLESRLPVDESGIEDAAEAVLDGLKISTPETRSDLLDSIKSAMSGFIQERDNLSASIAERVAAEIAAEEEFRAEIEREEREHRERLAQLPRVIVYRAGYLLSVGGDDEDAETTLSPWNVDGIIDVRPDADRFHRVIDHGTERRVLLPEMVTFEEMIIDPVAAPYHYATLFGYENEDEGIPATPPENIKRAS